METKNTVSERLTRLNTKRIQIILLLIFGVEALFLFYVERVRLLNATGEIFELIRVSYLLHLVLAIFTIVMAIVFHYIRSYTSKLHLLERLPLVTVFIVLMITATINVFDQITHGHITVFTVQLLLFGLLIYIRPPYQYLIYGVPYVLFAVGVLAFQESQDLIVSHMINATVITLGMIITSQYFFKGKVYELQYRDTLKRLNKELEALSTLDPLTKLPNRRYFASQIAYEIAINKRYNHDATLVIIDIDHFKEVNDKYGHLAGDFILKELGDFLKHNVRESDTVCRWGGEEFMLLLSHTDLKGAEILSERLRRKIESYMFLFEDKHINITVSAGITRLDHEKEDAFNISYARADEALYKAKNSGRNQIVIIKG